MTPELSRRDAIVALGAAGVATAGLGALAWETLEDDESEDSPADRRETIVAAAEALYPSEVDGVAAFIDTYVVGRIQNREAYLEGIQESAGQLEEYAEYWYDEPFADLDRARRQQVFDEFGLADAEPDPEGNEVERVRYYLVNELLFAFYSSPTGGELVGLENPQGHPGGTDSYQRGPPE
jgi:hypothetical protein